MLRTSNTNQPLADTSDSFEVLLYYRYVKIEDPESARKEQADFCKKHELLGRILVASEGINGTVSGLAHQTKAYREWMAQHPLFKGIEFKIDQHPGHTFNKLHVRVKNEIVHLGLGNEDVDPTIKTGKYIEPDELRDLLRNGNQDVVLLDARSRYEYEVGKFPNALTLDIENFRELPQQLEAISGLKDKTIVTYCTGGIKCEKASALLLKEGFTNVFQLHGGIVRYGHEAEGENFEGSCYVFDQRVVVPVNRVNPTIIGKCFLCTAPTEKMINCANSVCNRHFLICENCASEMEGCCSEDCRMSDRRRAWDGTGYYLRGINSKNYLTSSQKQPGALSYRSEMPESID